MAVTFLFIRHATNDFVGRGFAGRLPGVHLNATGKREAEQLAARLAKTRIDAIYVSPLERAVETAAPFAKRLGLEARKCPTLIEVNVGEWQGKAFSDIDSDPEWRQWVERRSLARPPNGESIVEVQARMATLMDELRVRHDGETVALVSHADVIKSALASVLRLSLDDLERFDIAPASVSSVIAGEGWAKVIALNDTGAFTGS